MAPVLSQKQWALSHFVLILILGLSLYQFFCISGQQLEVTFLNVGQGDAILIQTPEYKNILIDAGPDGRVVGELSKKLGFFNQKIDLFILTHPDLDHFGGALDLLSKYPVSSVMLTGIASSGELYEALIGELKSREITVIYPNSDKDLRVSQEIYLDILYPFPGQSLLGQRPKNKNDTSVSLIVRNKKKESLVLLTGDAEAKLELDMILSGQDLRSPVFKLGHHGSKTASTQLFLNAVKPRTVIVSAGKNNKFGHPHQEVLERVRGLETLSTENGSITLSMLK